MKLPEDTIIAVTTLYDELLHPHAHGNQVALLAKGGYMLDNWGELETDLRKLLQQDATRVRSDANGDYYEINGQLRDISVKTLWFWANEADAPQFVTLLPFS